jgi:chromate transporter
MLTWGETFKVWLRIGVLSFGGPTAQIALMHKEIVEEKAWLNEKQYLNALSFCMLLPGPEAMQLATYVGWRLQGIWGGLMAGLLFILPGALVIGALAAVYLTFGNMPSFNAVFLGIKATVIVIVLQALYRISKKALTGWQYWVIAVMAFIALFFFSIPFPMVIALAAVWGFVNSRTKTTLASMALPLSHPITNTFKTAGLWLSIWCLPLFALVLLLPESIFAELGIFFSKLAVVTFGGAYAVLSYMAQDVVVHYDWLTAAEMMDGLGLAETTPGPLILVTEFVGFVSVAKEYGLGLGVVGALVTLWATFVPCFLWIFTFAPYIEQITHQPKLSSALSAITAAVVGVIFNLSLWFALHVVFSAVSHKKFGGFSIWKPEWASVDWQVLLFIAINAVLLFKLRISIIPLILISSVLGWLSRFI